MTLKIQFFISFFSSYYSFNCSFFGVYRYTIPQPWLKNCGGRVTSRKMGRKNGRVSPWFCHLRKHRPDGRCTDVAGSGLWRQWQHRLHRILGGDLGQEAPARAPGTGQASFCAMAGGLEVMFFWEQKDMVIVEDIIVIVLVIVFRICSKGNSKCRSARARACVSWISWSVGIVNRFVMPTRCKIPKMKRSKCQNWFGDLPSGND